MPQQTHLPPFALIVLIGLAGAGPAGAQSQPDGLWHGGLSVGGSAASGNSKTRVLTANAEFTRETSEDKVTLRGLLNNGSSRSGGVSTTTARLLRLGGRYDNSLGDKWFAFSGAEAETDRVQGLNARWNANTGLGRHMVRNDDLSFDLFAGVGYSRSGFKTGEVRKGPEFTLGEESTHRINQLTSFKQRLVLYPGPASVGSRATLDATLATTLVGAWTLNAGGAWRYTSKVPPGVVKSDSLLTLGLGYKF